MIHMKTKLINILTFRFHAFHSEDLVRVMSEQKLMEANPLLQEVLLYRVEQPHSGRVCTVPGPPINPSRRKVISQLAVVVGGTARTHNHDNIIPTDSVIISKL